MSRAFRFAAVLIAGLAALTVAAEALVHATARGWFEKDVSLRARLAVQGSRRALIRHWRQGQWSELNHVLADLAHDEGVLAAAACAIGGSAVSKTGEWPDRFRCEDIGRHVFDGDQWREWSSFDRLVDGEVHLSAIPLADQEGTVGFVILLHDWSFVARREATLQKFLLFAFAVLAFSAAAITLVAARLSRRSWLDELRRLLTGGAARADFQPLMQDLRELVERLSVDREVESHAGQWTPRRLKQTLSRHLEGEKVIIVANCEPYIHERRPDGQLSVVHPASGLVTALEPVMRACSGVWVAHGSGSADRDVVDRRDRVKVPPGEESYSIRRVWLSPEEERGYYYGFANEGLWPLCHVVYTRPHFRLEDWRHYQRVNERFADAVAEEIDRDDPIVLVQDYHFALLPRLIRERLPKATILTFWHIPWPNAERFGICPWRDELLWGLLGSSILGFHTQAHCNHFTEAIDRYLEARIDREQNAVFCGGRATLVRPYPISIEWPSRWAAEIPDAVSCRQSVIAELGLPKDALVGVGVDRLDYTKGIEERLLAVERLLERFPPYVGRFTFVQLAAPSRTAIEPYRRLNEAVEAVASRINARFGNATYKPVILFRSHHEPPTVFRFYRAADVCYVSSLHDGMNLVAKEFVAARDDLRGVLVLSQFTGAARELTEALVVNPYDLEQASSALHAALSMPADEQMERMRSMRALLAEFNVYRWAGRMLVDASRLRQRERLSGRLTRSRLSLEGAA